MSVVVDPSAELKIVLAIGAGAPSAALLDERLRALGPIVSSTRSREQATTPSPAWPAEDAARAAAAAGAPGEDLLWLRIEPRAADLSIPNPLLPSVRVLDAWQDPLKPLGAPPSRSLVGLAATALTLLGIVWYSSSPASRGRSRRRARPRSYRGEP